MKKYLGRVVTAVSIVGLTLPAIAQQGGPNYGSHMWGGPWAFVGPLMMILLVVAIVAGVVLMLRWLGGTGHVAAHPSLTTSRPLDILKERYARGEIDKDELEERRRILGE